jgi:hypothetical protein
MGADLAAAVGQGPVGQPGGGPVRTCNAREIHRDTSAVNAGQHRRPRVAGPHAHGPWMSSSSPKSHRSLVQVATVGCVVGTVLITLLIVLV